MAQINIVHATALFPSGLLPDALVTVTNGKIENIEPYHGQMLDGEVIDATGRFLSPGWIDIQINGGFGSDFTDDPTAIWEVAGQLPRYGTTSFLPTIITSPPEKMQQATEVLRMGPPPGWIGAIPLGIHAEGPFLNPQKRGAHNPLYLQTPTVSMVEGWSRENGIWLVTLAPELPGIADVMDALTAGKVIISAGHSMATYNDAMSSFEKGIRCGTHLYNAMPPILHRDPGLTGALLTRPEIVVGLIADGIHCHPGMLQLAWRSKGPSGIALVTDAMGAMGMPPEKYEFTGLEITVDSSSARLGDGTLAGSILTMDQSLRNMIGWLQLKLEDVIPSVTSTPASLLGIPNKGHLVPGADADLVLLTDTGRVLKTWIGGQMVYSK
jgi:N-acetylglucosamine-6-phosphate deacetylase